MRTEKYSVPSCLDEHVASILNAIDIPLAESRRTPPPSVSSAVATRYSRFSESSVLVDGYVTPQLINNAYDIVDNTGHPRATQAAYASLGNFFSPEDLEKYQLLFDLPVRPVNQSSGSRSTEWCTNSGNSSCVQGNLEIQLMLGIADTPTIFYYTSLSSIALYLEYVVSLTTPPPLVISVSYGIAESLTTAAEMDLFDTNAIILGSMGTTIVTSAGDDGVSSWEAREAASSCGYDPTYPASSPYVISVGGTQVCCVFSTHIEMIGIHRRSIVFSTFYCRRVWRAMGRRLSASMTGVVVLRVEVGFRTIIRDHPGRTRRWLITSSRWETALLHHQMDTTTLVEDIPISPWRLKVIC